MTPFGSKLALLQVRGSSRYLSKGVSYDAASSEDDPGPPDSQLLSGDHRHLRSPRGRLRPVVRQVAGAPRSSPHPPVPGPPPRGGRGLLASLQPDRLRAALPLQEDPRQAVADR